MRCELTQSPTMAALAELEEVPCPHECTAGDELLHEFDRFRINRCKGCGLVRLNPRLVESQLKAIYDDDYFSGDHARGYDSYERDQVLYEKTFARRLKLIHRFKTSGRLLDIGCGLGYFLNVAAQKGFDPHGLDMSHYAVEQCQRRFPGRVQRGMLTADLFPQNSFDVVTMFDLFEHIYQPTDFLSVLHKITKDDGVIIITTPNHRSLLSRFSGRNWVSYKLPEHVFYYTPETLQSMVGPNFEVRLIRSEGQYCSMGFLAERMSSLNPLLGKVMVPIVNGLRIKDWTVYVNSGSMTAVLSKIVHLQ